MQINSINNLVELFFTQYEKQDKNKIFLNSLKDSNRNFSWEKVFYSVINLSNEISKHINKGDRCLLISSKEITNFIKFLFFIIL